MIPRILEYEDGRIKLTPEAYILPETNAIIMKYGDMDCEPYLGFVYMLSYPDTPYRLQPEEERREAAMFDVKATLGDFDENCELIDPAIERLISLWTSAQTLMADEMEEELHRWRKYLKETPLGGEEMKNRLSVVDKVEKTALTALNLRKIADEEISTKMKGANTLGEY
jgi:hypothetical protein